MKVLSLFTALPNIDTVAASVDAQTHRDVDTCSHASLHQNVTGFWSVVS